MGEVVGDLALDVVGVGNAIVDVLAEVDEAFVVEHGLAKGSMTLIDADRAVELYAAMPPGLEESGGSAANTMVGVASFGGRAAYIGKVADDFLGEVFRRDLRHVGVRFDVPGVAGTDSTGRCLIQVTPDAQRTMNTHLGISSHLSPDDVDTDLVASASHLYCEGYLWDTEEAKAAIRHAMDVAHAADRTVSLSLSDGFCVDRHRDEWRGLLTDRVDVVFGNAGEVCSLFEVDDVDVAADLVSRTDPSGRRRATRRCRHHGGRRPLRLRGSLRPQPGSRSSPCGPAREYRGGRGDQPPGSPTGRQPGCRGRVDPGLTEAFTAPIR